MIDRLAGRIYDLVAGHIDMDESVRKMKRLYTCTDDTARQKCRNFYTGIIKNILLVLIVCIVLTLVLLIKTVVGTNAVVLERQGYGGDTTVRTLRTELDGKELDFQVDVIPMEYSDDELKEAFNRGFELLDSIYLGANETADEVRKDLKLVDTLEETGLDVQWFSSDPELISSTGVVHNGELDAGSTVTLTAVLTYGDQSAEREYPVMVAAKEYTRSEQVADRLASHVRALQEGSSDRVLELPETIDGYNIGEEGEENNSAAILVLGIIAAACIWSGARVKIRNMEKDRESSLMLEYPGLVDKLVLYLGAGVTVRGAFARIAGASGSEGTGSPLERELIYTLNEIDAGVPEGEAYYNMGHRINIPVYMKLMSLLSQNIKKGTKDIVLMMSGEEQAALQMRRELARRKGEEAGTRLLFPMIILLGVVMVIVVLPAVMNF